MKFKLTLYALSFLFFTTSLTQCSSSKTNNNHGFVEFETKTSVVLGDVFFQKWIAGVQGGGSGYHLYMIVKENKKQVVFDSAYFRGLKAKLTPAKIGYIASFKSALNQKSDIKMSGDSLDEYGNIFAHQLESNECVISYYEKDKIKFLKLDSIIEKQAEYYPIRPPNEE